jgi:hypothetical protein
MLESEEFHNVRSKLFKNLNNIDSPSQLDCFIQDLRIISANERSPDIVNLVRNAIEKAKSLSSDVQFFTLYWIYFQQTYHHTQQIDQTKGLVAKMKKTAARNDNVEQQAIILSAESIISQSEGGIKEAVKLIEKAEEILRPHKLDYAETYYSIFYALTVFKYLEDLDYARSIINMNECFFYYYKQSNNTSGMIKSLALLLRFYTFSGQEEKTNKLLKWIFIEEKIQDKVIASQSVLLYRHAGTISSVLYKTNDVIHYLEYTNKKITAENLKFEMMYEYTYTLRILSRYYAFQGKFQESYDLLVELTDFMEQEEVKPNYAERNRKNVYYSSYYTLLFIYSQLDLDIENLKDKGLKKLYEYTRKIVDSTKISQNLLKEGNVEETNLKELLKSESEKSKDELYLILHQVLLTQEPYIDSDQKEENMITLRNYVVDPNFVDVYLAKIYLAKGNFNKFHSLVDVFVDRPLDTKEPILKIWREIFILLANYLRNPKDQSIVTELNNLKKHCENRNFNKIAEEINIYQRLIMSKRTISNLEERFKQTAFIDVFNEESKRLVLEYLDKE